jgi:pseudomonalisin
VFQICAVWRSSLFSFIALFLLSTLNAQVPSRITRRADRAAMVQIPNTTHPAVALATDLGRAASSLRMDRILLHLQSSSEQEAALQQMLAEQQDPSSPQYHAWLTPEQFGQQYGVAQADLDAITSWLELQGFQVTEISAGRRSIEFGGTARQVEDAFRTTMHHYSLNGARHLANASDISIPEAFASVVSGIVSLNDFHARPLHHVIPQTNLSGGSHGLSPYDFAAIYDVSPLWNANYDGTGQKIAVVGETNIKVSDVTAFRAMFGLPVNNPQVILNGPDPGIIAGAETEADLDVEWAGAVAKGATIQFVVSGSTASSDGITLSAQYIVNNNLAPVMTLSYGLCEAQLGSGNQFYYSLWQQAATEGISVFVASGDTGSAGCDVPYSSGSGGANATTPASHGFGVNGLASTPFNVAVGGTEFNDTASPSTFWNSSNDSHYASARGYIPEVAWNESSFTTPGASGNSLYAGGGGISTVWSRPSWQAGTGVPAGSTRVLPDVSLTAAGHDGYLIEQEGSLYLVGGTSASTPSFAGIMAMVNQYTGTRNGNPNAKFYTLAAHSPSVYHDTAGGSNAVPCSGGSSSCSAVAPASNVGVMKGYSASAGFDLATGWGSVDAYSLAINWGGAPVGPSITSLSPNPMTASASTQNLTINGAGFNAGSGLTVKVGTTTYSGTQITFMNSSLLVVAINPGTAVQSLAVQVTDPNGQSSNPVSLQITAPAAPLAISSISPNPMTGSNSGQILSINGTGFQAGLKLQIGGSTILASQLTSLSTTLIQVNIIVGLTTHTYPVQVINANGQVSNTVNFQVNGPVTPVITSLTPNPLTGSSKVQTLTINGTNFQAGAGFLVAVGSTVYQGSQVTVVSSTQVHVSVTLAPGTRTLGVEVMNPNGQVSNVAVLTVH